MQGRKFQLKTNTCEHFQENTEYQDSGGLLVFDGITLIPPQPIIPNRYLIDYHDVVKGW
jgi:hypothetical protein